MIILYLIVQRLVGGRVAPLESSAYSVHGGTTEGGEGRGEDG